MRSRGSFTAPMPLFANAVFELSAARLTDLPPPAAAEIAFAGRSNAGKSSAINTLAGRTRLAFVSKTPGRTQLINFFRLTNGAFLVDLPGYGYADVPEEIRSQWRGVLEGYLRRRSSVRGLVLIMDARRPLTQLDRQMLDWFAPTGKPIHVLLTKADKLTHSEAGRTLRAARAGLAEWGGQVSVQLFSSLKKTGMEEAEDAIAAWLGLGVADGEPEPQDARPAPALTDAPTPRGVELQDRRGGTRKKKPPAKGEKNRGRNALT